jgi:cell division protein FtsQ
MTRPGGAGSAVAGQPGAGARPPGRPAARTRDPRRALFLCVVAVVLVLAAGWALLGSSLLVVRHVEVTGTGQVAAAGVSAAQVRAVSGIRPGTPLARLNTATAARRVEGITQVLSAQVTRSWPDTVVIAVRERTPALAVRSDGLFELVDVHGVVIAAQAARPAGLPLLTSPPAQLRGSPAVRAAAVVLGDLPGSVRSRVVSVAAVTAGLVTLRLHGGITVLWGGPGRGPAKARELQALLRTGARHYDLSSPGTAVTSG